MTISQDTRNIGEERVTIKVQGDTEYHRDLYKILEQEVEELQEKFS